MPTDHRSLNRVFAAFCFLVALLLYLLTLAPTISFWDPAERVATAFSLQIPHPPGAPLYLLLGRLFSMFVPPESAAYAINLMSALASATTIMLLYLIIVRLVREFRPKPDQMETIDRIGMYGGGIIGALAFAVSDSHWFTSVEAETYALSLTFTALVVWLVLRWSENAEMPRSERWLLLITFLFGLAFGVHLLSLLAIFFVGLIIYFRMYEFEWRTFLMACGLTVLAFFTIFPITLIQIPTMAGAVERVTGGLLGPVGFVLLLLVVLSYAVYYTHKRGMRLANILLLGYMLILIGYSSYGMIYIRSQADPAIDQNSPDNIEDFISYLEREQYGQQPLMTGSTFDDETGQINREQTSFFPRRHSGEPRHLEKYGQYSSDLDFFVNYQVGHMYLRYFGWNFIGRDSDIQDAPVISGFGESIHEDNRAHNTFFYLPFLLGLIGMLYHFNKDWRRALSVTALFLATGIAIVIYLNQTPFQPRERDYSYTGSFFAFSIWIGLGATGVIELIRDYLRKNIYAACGALLLCFIAVPVVMGTQTYTNNDRNQRYVANDYAYNLLNSLEPYSIVFTNGDNDTFPLWYLQEVEGVRTDVRVINLSLLNTPWYIKQMKNKWQHESPPVPISLSDSEIERLDEKFRFESPDDFHQPREVSIPVDKDLLQRKFESDAERLPPSEITPEAYEQAPEHFTADMSFGVPVEELDDEVSWFFEGRSLGTGGDGQELHFTRIQDDIVMDILQTNNWVRPVYFAITVPSGSQLDLGNYLRMEGKALRVVPQQHNQPRGRVDTDIHGERLERFRFRETDNENAYFDENIRRMLDNYRTIFNRQADTFIQRDMLDQAAHWLRWGEERIPFSVVEGSVGSMITYAHQYTRVDELERASAITEKARPRLMQSLRDNMRELNRMERRLSELRQQGGTDAQRQMQRLQREREMVMQDIGFDSSRLIVVQYVYYLTDRDDRALGLANEVAEVSEDRLPFPTTEEENRQRVQELFE